MKDDVQIETHLALGGPTILGCDSGLPYLLSIEVYRLKTVFISSIKIYDEGELFRRITPISKYVNAGNNYAKFLPVLPTFCPIEERFALSVEIPIEKLEVLEGNFK